MNYGETVRTFYGQSSAAPADASSPSQARARRLCAGVLVAGAVFAWATPAHADDGLSVGGVSAASIEATVAAVQTAAIAQASAIVSEAATPAADAAPAAPAAPAASPATPQTGSGSGAQSGISGGATSAPTSSSARPAVAPAAAPATEAPAEPAVVAQPRSVVSEPDTEPPSTASPQTSAVPSAAFHKLAREYQQNAPRYQSVNSLPISRATVPSSTLESVIKRAPFSTGSSAPNAGPIGAANCPGELPESDSQATCEEPRPEPAPPPKGHPHVGAVANAPAASSSAAAPDAAVGRSVGSVQGRLDELGAVASSTQPLPQATPTKVAPSGPATPATPQKAAAADTVKGPGRRVAPPAQRANGEPMPLHVDRPRNPTGVIRTEAAERESARADRPSGSPWPWLGLALLLFGLTSIGLAFASVSAGGVAAASSAAARIRMTAVSAAGISTRVRSKGLSARASGAAAERPGTRGGIRYRD
jgi:hypothetical protein